MNNILFVSYYTEGYYKEIANKYLIPSLKKFNLPYHIEEKPNLHNWLKNGKYKTQFIFDMLLTNRSDIVWLDADAELFKFPQLFYELSDNINIGVHYLDWYKFWHQKENGNKKELLTGTIYLKNSEKTLYIIDQWNKMNQSSPEWAQRLLPTLLNKNQEIKVYELPIEYCQIIKKNKLIPKNTIIAQHQVSRETRNGEVL
jgi:hypothetical protein